MVGGDWVRFGNVRYSSQFAASRLASQHVAVLWQDWCILVINLKVPGLPHTYFGDVDMVAAALVLISKETSSLRDGQAFPTSR
jgi:hypothetical protein